jgi:hypothetical protein
MKHDFQQRAWFNSITQNTGSHVLDSGGAYGRHWERNAKLTIDDAYSWDYRLEVASWGWNITINVLHYLTQNFTIDREVNARFHRFCYAPAQEDDTWFECLQKWVDSIGGAIHYGENTYNHDNWLSQNVLTHIFTDGDQEGWLAIATHNGCDARGGYSKFWLCREDDTDWNVGLTDGWIGCKNGHQFYADGPSHWICDDPHKTYKDDDIKVASNGHSWWVVCPVCRCKLDC